MGCSQVQVWGAVCRAILQRGEPRQPVTNGELFTPRGVEKAVLQSDHLFRRCFQNPG